MTIASIANGEAGSSVRTKLNSGISFINARSDYKSVKDSAFGAVGGYYTDDTVAINAALADDTGTVGQNTAVCFPNDGYSASGLFVINQGLVDGLGSWIYV